ncbi:MBL fold metallo-hydrolase [Chloroflexota bacterium]
MVKMIYRALEIMPFGTNCYLVGSNETRDGLVIDPAGDPARILSNIDELGLNVGLIVVTHAHPDHLGAVGHIVQSTGGNLAVHVTESEILRRNIQGQPAGLVPIPDKLLKDDDSLIVGDLRFRVMHTPGHSPGGICVAGYGVVFSGDTLFNMSIGRTDGPGCDYNLLISGIRNKLLTLPDQTVVLPGHGPKTTIGRERRGNPFLR